MYGCALEKQQQTTAYCLCGRSKERSQINIALVCICDDDCQQRLLLFEFKWNWKCIILIKLHILSTETVYVHIWICRIQCLSAESVLLFLFFSLAYTKSAVNLFYYTYQNAHFFVFCTKFLCNAACLPATAYNIFRSHFFPSFYIHRVLLCVRALSKNVSVE